MRTSFFTSYAGIWGFILFFAVASPSFGQRASAIIWTNAGGNRLWDYETANWIDDGQATKYLTSDTASFTDTAAGTVDVRPDGISLSNSFLVNSAADYLFQGGTLSGIGGLTKTGMGRLTLASANTYSGSTVVGSTSAVGGTLALANAKAAQNSSIYAYGSTVEVQQSGTTVKNLILADAGSTGSLLKVYVDAANVLTPALTADAFYYDTNARVSINVDGFSGNTTTYQVLSGSGAGDIDTTNVYVSVNTQARVKRTVTGDATSLYVTLTQSTFGALYGEWLTYNGWRVAKVVDYAAAHGIQSPLFNALEALPGYGIIVGYSLNQLHAEAYVTEMSYAAQLQRDFNARLMNWRNMVANNGYYGYTDCNCYSDGCGYGGRKPRRFDLWATVSAESMTRSRVGDYSGYDGDSCGLTVGAEWKFSRCWYGGIALGYDDASQDYLEIDADNDLRAARMSLYGGYVNCCWYGSGHIGYSKDWHDTTRRIRIPGFSTDEYDAPGFAADARGRYNDNVFSTGIEFGKFYSCYDLNLIPTIGVNYVYVHSPRIEENNADSANLVVNGTSYNSLRMPVGLRTNMDICLFSGLVLTPEMRLFGVTEWADRSVRRSAYFAETPEAGVFYSEGGSWGRNGILFGLGLTAQCCCRVTLGFNYDCESWKEYNRHVGSAFLNYRW